MVGVGTALGVRVCERKTVELKECGETSRSEMRLDFESSHGCCSSRLASGGTAICRPIDTCYDPCESRERKNGNFRGEAPERIAGMILNSLQFFGPCFAIK